MCCTTIPPYITAVFLCELDYFDTIELCLNEVYSSFIFTTYTKTEPP